MKTYKTLVGIFMLPALSFAVMSSPGCTGDIKSELDDLRSRVETLEDLVETLDETVKSGAMITTIAPLPAPESGWLINFTGNREPLKVYHGDKGATGEKGETGEKGTTGEKGATGEKGHTPLIEVRTNPDGSTTLWVDGENTGKDLTGPKGANGENGENGANGNHGISPKIEVRPNEGGEGLSIWYNITPEYPDEAWVNTGVDISGPEPSGSLWTIIENANGTVTLVLNDDDNTEYVFARHSSANYFQIMNTKTVDISGTDGTIVFRVNPSNAYIPTGTGEAIAKWTLDEYETTRAGGYTNPSQVFTIESILPAEGKAGQFVATISADFDAHDVNINEYVMALVLNNNTGDITAEDAYISSAPFKLSATDPGLEFVFCAPQYYGEEYHPGTSNFAPKFTTYVPFSDDMNGWMMELDIIAAVVDESPTREFLDIPAGVYTFDNSGEINTVGIEYSLVTEVVNQLELRPFGEVVGGTMTVEGDHTGYHITFDIILPDVTLKGFYDGPILTENPKFEPVEFIDSMGSRFDGTTDGKSNFYVSLTTYDPYASDKTGWKTVLNFVTEAVDESYNKEFVSIPAGTYTYSDSGEANTISVGPSLYPTYIYETTRFGGFAQPYVGLKELTVVVEGDHTGYTFKINAIRENDAVFSAVYTGAIPLKNTKYVTPAPGPVDIGTLSTFHSVTCYPDNYGDTGEVDVWMMTAYASPGVTVQWGSLMGTGWIFYAQVSTPLESESIPDGEYTVGTDGKVIGNALAGYMEGNAQYGTWVRRIENGAVKEAYPLASGTLTSTFADGEYTIQLNAAEAYGNPITGTIKAAKP